MSKTYGQQFDEANACKTEVEAAAWLEKEIARHVKEFGQTPEKAKEVILINIGYMAGYYDSETAHRINRLFGAEHPIFGGDDYFENVSPEQAFQAGQDYCKKYKESK